MNNEAAFKVRSQAIVEMLSHGLYVFGGNHTHLALKELLFEYKKVGTRVPSVWEHWPCIIFAFTNGFRDYSQAIDAAGEFDNVKIQREMTLLDRVVRWRERFVDRFGTYENFLNAKSSDVEKYVADMQRTLPSGGSVSTAKQIANIVATPPELFKLYMEVISGGYPTRRPEPGSKKAPPRADAVKHPSKLDQICGMRNERQMILLRQVISGNMTLDGAQKMAREIKKILRCRNYILELFWHVNGGQKSVEVDGEVHQITWEFLQQNFSVEFLIHQYINFFANANAPPEVQGNAMLDYVEHIWAYWFSEMRGTFILFLHLYRVLAPAEDPALKSCPWLRAQRPNSSDYNVYHGPNSSVLTIKCRTEDLHLWIKPQVFRMFYYYFFKSLCKLFYQ